MKSLKTAKPIEAAIKLVRNPLRRLSGTVAVIGGISAALKRVLEAQARDREHILAELVTVRGFMPLLMKPRNGGRWTKAERQQLADQLQALANLSPYLVVMVLPGSFVALPVLAWWLDRRRLLRTSGAVARNKNSAT